MTCHDPHRNAEKSPGFYESKCRKCHKLDAVKGVATMVHNRDASMRSGTACPVDSAGGCLDCHMPRVRDATPHMTFTDHHIRVHRAAPTDGDRKSKFTGHSTPAPMEKGSNRQK
jgi:hypothetical protein